MRAWALDFSRTETTSPAAHWYEGTLTAVPFTSIALCETSWRASARVAAKPMRYTTLSRRPSRKRSRFSPVEPGRPAAFA